MRCFRCKNKVNNNISNKQYYKFCPNCYEDLFRFEVEE